MPTLVVEIALKSFLISAAAVGLVAALRGLPAAQRAAAAHLGLLAILATPLLVLFGPDLPLTGFWSRTVDLAAAPSTVAQTAQTVQTATLSSPATPAAVDLGLAWPLAWIIGSAVLAAALLSGLVRLFLLQRDAEVLTDRDWLSALAHAQRRMKLKAGTALLRSDRVTSPISWGLLRPTIVLSPAAVAVPHRAEAIIAHELAHVIRLDWLNLMIARLATTVFWFNPLVWILAWQAHELREEAADDVVLRGDVDGPDYADLLVHFARGEARASRLAAHGVGPGKASLKRRVRRALDQTARRDPAPGRWTVACAAIVAAVAVPLAAFTPIDRTVGAEPAAPSIFRAALPFLSPSSAMAASLEAREGPAAEPGEVTTAVDAGAETGGEQSNAEPRAQDQAQLPFRPQALTPELAAQMRLIGVTPEWISSLEGELPWIRSLSAREMMNLAGNQVEPEWVRSLREVGYDDLTYDQVLALAANQIGPDYVRELAAAGYRNLPLAQLIQLKTAGVDGDYVRRMQAAGVRVDPHDADARRGPDRDRRQSPASPPSVPPPGEE